MDFEQRLPVVALRDVVVFPNMSIPIFVGRKKSLAAIELAQLKNMDIFLSLQKTDSIDYPMIDQIHSNGIIASIVYALKLADGTLKIFVKGKIRAQAVSFIDMETHIEAQVEKLDDEVTDIEELKALHRLVCESFESWLKLKKRPFDGVQQSHETQSEIAAFVDFVAQRVEDLQVEQKQILLFERNLNDRLEQLYTFLQDEIHLLELQAQIRKRLRAQIEKNSKSYQISEQLRSLQKEILPSNNTSEADDLEKKIKSSSIPAEPRDKLLSELDKYRKMNPFSPEASLVSNYISYAVGMPWNRYSSSNISLQKAEKVLDEGHYGMEKIKERVLEYIAVLKKAKKVRGSILCLVGPPGVGKTSLVKSIAKALSRKFTSTSLGGVHDVAEIRGHRRTYIGAMPGKIIQGIKSAGTSDPVFLLDEIDKMGSDFRGDPASALLDVLDPEHNHSFSDHYLDIPYDLSRVLFIATANTINLPRALVDRMEILDLPGYADNEKLEIAKLHLIPKQLKEHHLKNDDWSISDDMVLNVISEYTGESGVRELERSIAKLMRKAVRESFESSEKIEIATAETVKKYLGAPKFIQDFVESNSKVGVAIGLAYSAYGGSILKLEAIFVPGGKGEIKITGKLGKVMQESVKAAHSLALATMKEKFGVDFELIGKFDIHIHFPSGAVPKDGPSAGIAIYTVISSLISNIPVNRFVAMTGEITLRGEVLQIGGLKEKLLAAIRSGIKTVLIPDRNRNDMEEISEYIKSKLNIVFVNNVHDVLNLALVHCEEGLNSSNEQCHGQLILNT